MTFKDINDLNLFKAKLYIIQAAEMLNQQALDIAALATLQDMQVHSTIRIAGELSRLKTVGCVA